MRWLLVVSFTISAPLLSHAPARATPQTCTFHAPPSTRARWSSLRLFKDAQGPGAPIADVVDGRDWEIDLAVSGERPRIRANNPRLHLRFEGHVEWSDLDLVATRDLPVVAGAVSIPTGVSLRVTPTSNGDLVAEPRRTPFAAPATAIACADVSLDDPPQPAPFAIKGAMQLRRADVPLSRVPGGAPIFTLRRREPTAKIERSPFAVLGSAGPFVHVRHVSDLAIDGWIAAHELEPYFRVVAIDPMITVLRDRPNRTVKRETKLLTGPFASPVEVAVLEPGARVFVYGTPDKFAGVHLTEIVRPSPGEGFYVLSKDLSP
jgi:hypothetical protein